MMKPFSAASRLTFKVVILMVGTSTAAFADISLPEGWRMPTKSELAENWRDADPNRYSVAFGDFDGDGLPDRAVLLISDRRHSFALFVHSADGNHRYTWHKIDEDLDSRRLQGMGVEVVPPGRYSTSCGKAYIACDGTSPKEIKSSNQLIKYFKVESANRYVYFNELTRTFEAVWISD